MKPETGVEPQVLVADDDHVFVRSFQESLSGCGVPSVWAQTAPEAIQLVRHHPGLCIAFVDSRISATGGLALLQQIHQQDPNLTVILMSSSGTLTAALEATKRGAADYVLKPFELRIMAEKVSRYRELFRIVPEDQEATTGPGPIRRLEDSNFQSTVMRAVVEEARRATRTDIPILLTGERGVGKDMLARAIQSASPRSAGPYLRVDCSSELADPSLRDPTFSGEGLRRLFEAAACGTLLLSEVGDLPPNLQDCLVSFLAPRAPSEGEDSRPGSARPRIITSSSHPLQDLRESRLRPQLFSLVAGVILEVPPLRERREDIAPLVRYFMGRLGRRYNHRFVMSWSGFDLLLRYSLPGNVRELECILERVAASTLQTPRRVTFGDLRPHLDEGGLSLRMAAVEEQPLDLGRIEQLAIERALWFAKGNRTKAAALLGIDRTTLHSKLRRFGKEIHAN